MPEYEVETIFRVAAETEDAAFKKVDNYLDHLYRDRNGLAFEMLEGCVTPADDSMREEA